jgi:hypothetical protein
MNDTKTVHLVSSRPRRDVQVQIGPTDTATDVLTRAGLSPNDSYIINPGNQAEFKMDELVHPAVSDGAKLNVVPQSSVGGAPPRPLPSYAQDQGWTTRYEPDGSLLHEGYFRALGLRWEGRVHQTMWGMLMFEINNPPLTYIRLSPWAGCFHALQGLWMWITFSKQPADVDSGIAAVNKLLKHVYDDHRANEAARRYAGLWA